MQELLGHHNFLLTNEYCDTKVPGHHHVGQNSSGEQTQWHWARLNADAVAACHVCVM